MYTKSSNQRETVYRVNQKSDTIYHGSRVITQLQGIITEAERLLYITEKTVNLIINSMSVIWTFPLRVCMVGDSQPTQGQGQTVPHVVQDLIGWKRLKINSTSLCSLPCVCLYSLSPSLFLSCWHFDGKKNNISSNKQRWLNMHFVLVFLTLLTDSCWHCGISV